MASSSPVRPPRIHAIAPAAALGAALVLSVAPATHGQGRRVQEEPVSDATPRLGPGLVLEGRDGQDLDLGDLVGQRVLIVTWASW